MTEQAKHDQNITFTLLRQRQHFLKNEIGVVILAHENEDALNDMVKNVKYFCPEVDILLYNSGSDTNLGLNLDIVHITPSQRLEYARITPFFFDVFNWLKANSMPYKYIVNLDNDVLFIRRGFEEFVRDYMKDVDYVVQWFSRKTAKKSRWRPIHSLRPELDDWYKFFGFEYTNRGFNPGQIFSSTYIERLLNHNKYGRLLELVENNHSYTLHEVLFPTLVDFLNLRAKSYPNQLKSINRWRPYQAMSGVNKALLTEDAYFIHPVRLELQDPARRLVRALLSV